MSMNITFRGIEPIDTLKDYARGKVEQVHKYLDASVEAHVVLSLERHLHAADITVHSGPFFLRGREKCGDMYTSLDLAMDKIVRQLRRYKDRLKHHHGKDRVHHREGALKALRVRHNVLEVSEPESVPQPDGPRIIRNSEFLAHPMSVEDAVMQMDLIGNDFLVFTNVGSKEMNVVYRRKDGHYGLIEASASHQAELAAG